MDIVILNRDPMSKMTPELATLGKLLHHTSGRSFHPLRMMQQAHKHDRSLGETGFEPGALEPRRRSHCGLITHMSVNCKTFR
ncbi:hypothetical protein AVEN_218266-1 [Araneus ventricosus]|uniref:Uncharacterized protein n=1 Tax=Araneus ventricosus TaxID=182803 RepID=A0A4Y2T461_ARAVE|nr:hypothetical protein AVEN_218266-1 [Araneus ventricosus]